MLQVLLFFQDRHACIGYGSAKGVSFKGLNTGFHALCAHYVRVLGHGAEQVSVVNQSKDGIRFIKANADDPVLTRCLDGIASACGGSFVTAKDARHALGDVVLGNALGLGCIAFPVLCL